MRSRVIAPVDPDAVDTGRGGALGRWWRRRRTRKIPYFDRPKHPKDWRWFVGGLGRTLIILGLLMFGFVAYQLWGTGIQTARAQNELRDDFEAALQSTTTLAPTTTTVPDPTGSVPDSVPTATTTTTVPVAEAAPPAADGDWLGQIHIPKIGVDKIYVEGTSVASLRDGPGHFRETPMPGQLGNAAIAGHRTTYGAPFGRLDELQIGDDIQVQTLVGNYLYRVTETFIVEPGDYAAVIPSRDPSLATLTLVTCTPEYTSSERLVVRGTLVADQSSQVFQPPSVTAPADTPSTVPDTLPGEGAPESIPPADSVDSVPDTALPTTTIVEINDDAFSQGFLDDPDAPPHVVGWLAVLAVIVLGSYWAGRWANRLWVCWVVGFVPFTIGLYFFYENVTRLLPPSL